MSNDPNSTPATAQRWTADTLLAKYFGVTAEAPRIAARERLKAATERLVCRIDDAPEAGVKARLVFGFKGGDNPVVLELRDNGVLEAPEFESIDEAGRLQAKVEPSAEDEYSVAIASESASDFDRLAFKDLERAAQNQKARVHLNAYAAISLINQLATTLGEDYEAAMHRALRETQTDYKLRIRFDKVANHLARKVVGGRAGKQIQDFRKLLEPQILKGLDKVTDQSPELYNALAARDSSRPNASRNRLQAQAAFPLISRLIANDAELRLAIDLERPLKPAVAAALARRLKDDGSSMGEPTQAVVSRLAGLTWQKAGRHAYREPGEFIQGIADTPLDWCPKDRKGWAAHAVVIGHVKSNLYRVAGLEGAKTAADFMKILGPDWVKAAERINAHSGLQGVSDLKRALVKNCIEPLLYTEIRREAAALGYDPATLKFYTNYFNQSDGDKIAAKTLQEMTSDAGQQILESFRFVRRALDASDAWHERLNGINAEVHEIRTGTDPMPVEWGSAAPEWTHPNGLTLTMLPSEAALQAEGLKMDHCVGGYAEACAEKSIILSISKGGQPVATAELIQDQDDGSGRKIPFAVSQVMGPGNKTQPENAKKAVVDWIRAVKKGEIPFDRQALAEGREKAKAALQQNALDATNLDPGKRQAIWDLYARFMPKSMREAGSPDAFLEQSGLKARLQERVHHFLAETLKERAAIQTTPAPQPRPEDHQVRGQQDRAWARVTEALRRLNPFGREPGAEPAR